MTSRPPTPRALAQNRTARIPGKSSDLYVSIYQFDTVFLVISSWQGTEVTSIVACRAVEAGEQLKGPVKREDRMQRQRIVPRANTSKLPLKRRASVFKRSSEDMVGAYTEQSGGAAARTTENGEKRNYVGMEHCKKFSRHGYRNDRGRVRDMRKQLRCLSN